MNLEQALAIIDRLDALIPRADETCEEPGITVSEAARRILVEEGHPAFAAPTQVGAA